MTLPSSVLLLALCAGRSLAASVSISPQQLADTYGLTTTMVWAFPPSPIDNTSAANYVTTTPSWGVSRIIENGQDLSFIADPFPQSNPNVQNGAASPSNVSATVMAVNYPAGSFSHGTGGVQFDNTFDSTGTAGYQTMVVSYEVAFQEGFQFVQGGKLPGLRGGPDTSGCSGGVLPQGNDCFSMRLMWRTLGSGEVYAYVPTPNNFCGGQSVRCNDDGFGISIDRAQFSFTPGQWTRITMLIQLNDPTYANGVVTVYYNDLLAVKMQNVYYRSSTSIASVQGMYFSTFFGGNDVTWATPTSQNTYFRNIQMWAGTAQSNVTGQPVKSLNGASGLSSSFGVVTMLGALVGAALLL